MGIFGLAAAVIAVVLFGAFVLLGAVIDGRRQRVRESGRQPVTTPEGDVIGVAPEKFD